jgi:hypothetical protein
MLTTHISNHMLRQFNYLTFDTPKSALGGFSFSPFRLKEEEERKGRREKAMEDSAHGSVEPGDCRGSGYFRQIIGTC